MNLSEILTYVLILLQMSHYIELVTLDNGEHRYRCRLCFKHYSQDYNAVAYLKSKHFGRACRCSQCGYKNPRRNMIKYHLRDKGHGDKFETVDN